MADTTITSLPGGSTPLGPEYIALDQAGSTVKLSLSDLFQQGGEESITSLSFGNSILTYTDESGLPTNIDLSQFEDTLTSLSFNNNTLSYTDEDGSTIDIPLDDHFLTLTQDSVVSVDNLTIGLTSTNKAQVKDGGITPAKLSNNSTLVWGQGNIGIGKSEYQGDYNAGIEINPDLSSGETGTAYVDFHSTGATSPDYDGRIQYADNQFTFKVNDGTEVLTLTDDGNVIASTAAGDISFHPSEYRVEASEPATHIGIYTSPGSRGFTGIINNKTGTDKGGLFIGTRDNNGDEYAIMCFNQLSDDTPTEILTNGRAGELFYVQSNGNVGAAGDITATGNVITSTPTSENHAVTKAYVDNITIGVNQKWSQLTNTLSDVPFAADWTSHSGTTFTNNSDKPIEVHVWAWADALDHTRIYIQFDPGGVDEYQLVVATNTNSGGGQETAGSIIVPANTSYRFRNYDPGAPTAVVDGIQISVLS